MVLRRLSPVSFEEQYVELVHARASALLRTACLLTAGDRLTAEDLIQIAMVRAYAKRRRGRTPTATEADARRTLVRAAIRGRRDGGRRFDDGDAAGRAANRHPILDALRALPTRQRAVAVLRYYDDYSETQIADVLGCPAGTVRRDGSRAREALGKQRSEEQLRASMEAAADPVHADPELVGRVIEQSRSARQQRRRSWWLSGCAAALTALVGASLIFLDGSEDSPPEPDLPRLIEVDPIMWARQLPRGPPIRLPYVVDGGLHVPGKGTLLPGEAGAVIGKTSAGWLVAVERFTEPRKGGLPDVTLYGILTAEGRFEPLPRDPYHGSPGVQALSPDGELFAMGGALIDVAQREVVGRTPEDALIASQWTAIGLLYRRGLDASSWLWRPGNRPIRLPAIVWEIAATAPVGLTSSRDGCTNVVHLAADGGVDATYEGCAAGASPPVSLSPSGAYALTADLDVLDVDEGTVTPFELPSSGIVEPDQLGWEDNDHFVLPVESRETMTRDRVVFVRCSTATNECERAGAEFTKPAGEAIPLT
jgi:RNA polymerase sigma factor (sigma-70 family)